MIQVRNSILLLASSLLAVWASPASAVDIREMYLREFHIASDRLDSTSFLLVVENRSPVDGDEPYMPLYLDAAFAAEPNFTPVVQFVEGTARLVENHKTVEVVELLPGALPSWVDQQMLQPIHRFSGYFRDFAFHHIRIKVGSGPRAIRPVPGRQTLIVERFVFRVTVRRESDPLPVRDVSRARADDPHAWPLVEATVLNAAMLGSFSPPPPDETARAHEARVRAWAHRLEAAAVHMPPLRLRTAEPGIHAIAREDLETLGFDPLRIRLETLRLLEGEREIPLLVVPESATAATWEALLFHSPGADRVTKPHRAYWLVSEPDTDPPPARIAWAHPDRQTPSEPLEESAFASLERARTFFEFRNYSHAMPVQCTHGRWSWVTVPQGEFRELVLEVPGGAPFSGEAILQVELAGSWREETKSVALHWNHEFLRDERLRGQRTARIEAPIAAEALHSGTNRLAVEFTDPPKGRIAETLEVTDVHLRWTVRECDWDNQAPHVLSATANEQNATRSLRIAPAPDGGLERAVLLDVTDPDTPVRLALAADGAGTGGLVAQESRPGERRYQAATLATALAPWRIERRDPPRLAVEPNAADYIAITVAELADQTRRLLALKQSQGLRTALLDTEALYDAFGYGVKSSEAIADFLKYAYGNWTPPRPFYLCLIGETSDYLADANGIPDGVQPDLVPNFDWGDPTSRVRGDYKYGYVSGSDTLADLSVGRISVADARELAAAIDKVVAYQTAPPPGAWRARHLFFTDDEREFQDIADIVIADAASSLSLPQRLYLNEYHYEPYLRHIERRHSPEATAELKHWFNEGVATAVYLGHGGPNVMSSERLFHLQDIPTLREGSPPTYLGSASCDTAWLDYPKAPFTASIGELMVKLPNRGAIGMFGPVSGASSSMHRHLFRSWYQAVVGDTLRHTGEIALYAQNFYFISQNSAFVPEQYVLIGDPAVPLPEPHGAGLEMEVSTSVLLTGIAETLEVHGRTTSIRYGWVSLSLRNHFGSPVVPDQRVRLIDGEFSVALEIESQGRPGDLVLRADAMNEAQGQWEMGSTVVKMVRPALTVDLTTDPPPTTRFRPGQFSRLIQTVINETEHTLPQLHIHLTALGLAEPLAEWIVDLAPGEQWQEVIGGPTPPGINRMELVVGRPGHEGLTPLGRSTLIVRAPSPTRAAALAMPESGLEAFPRPGGEGTEFEVQLENLSGRTVSNFSVQLWEVPSDSDPTTTMTGVMQVASIPPAGGVTLRLDSDRVFPLLRPIPVLVMIRADPEVEPTLEMPATVIFERHAMMLPRVNVRVVPDTLELSRTHVTRDETIFVTAEIENIGRDPVHEVLVENFLDAPWDRANWARPNPHNYDVRIPVLLPNQRASVRLRFDTPVGVIGWRTLYLIANSRRQFTEDTYEDNVAEHLFQRDVLPDLAVTAADVSTSPVLVSPGQPQELFFVVSNNDVGRVSGPIEVAVEATSPGRDWTPVAPNVPVRSIGPGRSVPMNVRWTPRGQETQIRIVVNPDRLFLERIHEDNRLVLPVLAQVESQLSTLPLPSSEAWDQKTIFPITVFEHAATRPNARIAYIPRRSEYHAGERFGTPTSSEAIEEAESIEDPPPDLWAFASGTFATHATGTPPPIAFRLERPEPDIDFYEVYFQVPSARAMPDGHPRGRILARVGEDPEPRLLNGLEEPGFWCHAGRHRVDADKGLDVVFEKPDEVVHSGVMRYLLLPAVGRLVSPAIRFEPDTAPFRTRLQGKAPARSRIELRGRWGELRETEMHWSEWESLATLADNAEKSESPEITPRDDWFQWEALLFPTVKDSPELEDIHLLRP